MSRYVHIAVDRGRLRDVGVYVGSGSDGEWVDPVPRIGRSGRFVDLRDIHAQAACMPERRMKSTNASEKIGELEGGGSGRHASELSSFLIGQVNLLCGSAQRVVGGIAYDR